MSSSSLRRKVINSYRSIIRAQKQLFENDLAAQTKALQEIRSHYNQKKHLTETSEIEKSIAEAMDACEFMKTGLIQVIKNEQSGNYSLNVKEQHLIDDEQPPSSVFPSEK